MAEAAAKPAGAEILSVSDLQAWYGESHILHGINFNVKAGEVVTLLGRNGAGKTTTLKSVMGIIGKRTGSIRFNGQDIIARLVRQDRAAWASRSVPRSGAFSQASTCAKTCCCRRSCAAAACRSTRSSICFRT